MEKYHVAEHQQVLVNSRGGPLTDRSVRRILDKYVKAPQYKSMSVLIPSVIPLRPICWSMVRT
jgi:site-specific recombinase XerD